MLEIAPLGHVFAGRLFAVVSAVGLPYVVRAWSAGTNRQSQSRVVALMNAQRTVETASQAAVHALLAAQVRAIVEVASFANAS